MLSESPSNWLPLLPPGYGNLQCHLWWSLDTLRMVNVLLGAWRDEKPLIVGLLAIRGRKKLILHRGEDTIEE